MDFIKKKEKSWAEVQVDRFSFECRGCVKMKGQEVEMEQLRQLIILALVGKEEVDCASGSGGGTVDDKERDGREGDGSEMNKGIRSNGDRSAR